MVCVRTKKLVPKFDKVVSDFAEKYGVKVERLVGIMEGYIEDIQ
jgi:hypothetical protein